MNSVKNSNFEQIVFYVYDSYDKIISIRDNLGNVIDEISNIGLINPFRYREYYYDNETDFYYLNSGYYNPIWGRFINADGIIAGISGQIGSDVVTSMMTGKPKISPWQTYVGSAFGGAAGVITTKIPGITNGRNSYQSIYKSGLTKIGNNTASNMSFNVMGKGFATQISNDIFSTGINGVRGYIDNFTDNNFCQYPMIRWDQ